MRSWKQLLGIASDIPPFYLGVINCMTNEKVNLSNILLGCVTDWIHQFGGGFSNGFGTISILAHLGSTILRLFFPPKRPGTTSKNTSGQMGFCAYLIFQSYLH